MDDLGDVIHRHAGQQSAKKGTGQIEQVEPGRPSKRHGGSAAQVQNAPEKQEQAQCKRVDDMLFRVEINFLLGDRSDANEADKQKGGKFAVNELLVDGQVAEFLQGLIK
jgi:hypothetical protein